MYEALKTHYTCDPHGIQGRVRCHQSCRKLTGDSNGISLDLELLNCFEPPESGAELSVMPQSGISKSFGCLACLALRERRFFMTMKDVQKMRTATPTIAIERGKAKLAEDTCSTHV